MTKMAGGSILIVLGLWWVRVANRELGISSAPPFWARPAQGKRSPMFTQPLFASLSCVGVKSS